MKKIISVVPVLLLGISAYGEVPCSPMDIDMFNESILDMQYALQEAEDNFAQYMNDEQQGNQTLKQLFIAIAQGNKAAVEELATPQNVNSREAGKTPLLKAVEGKKLDIIKILLAKGADVNLADTTTGVTPLMTASFYLNEPIIRELQTKKIDANATDNNGKSPLGYVYFRVMKDSKKNLSDEDVRKILTILQNELKIKPTPQDESRRIKCTR